MTPSPDYLARLDELVAQTKEEKPRSVRSTISTATSEGGYWRWNGQEWLPARSWSTDPASAAQLRQDVKDAKILYELTSYGPSTALYILPNYPSKRGRILGQGETEEMATVLCWLRWKGVEVPE